MQRRIISWPMILGAVLFFGTWTAPTPAEAGFRCGGHARACHGRRHRDHCGRRCHHDCGSGCQTACGAPMNDCYGSAGTVERYQVRGDMPPAPEGSRPTTGSDQGSPPPPVPDATR